MKVVISSFPPLGVVISVQFYGGIFISRVRLQVDGIAYLGSYTDPLKVNYVPPFIVKELKISWILNYMVVN